MAFAPTEARHDRIAWIAQRIRDVLILAAGIGLALPLILPFA